jgi:hypothetical protein
VAAGQLRQQFLCSYAIACITRSCVAKIFHSEVLPVPFSEAVAAVRRLFGNNPLFDNNLRFSYRLSFSFHEAFFSSFLPEPSYVGGYFAGELQKR